ncbi:MAG: hypothetical protein QM633_16005, partial [Propionicimonas sp.]
MPSGGPTGMPSGRPGGMPSGTASGAPGGGRDNGQFLQTMAKSLAEKLGLDETTVLTALQEVWQDQGGFGGQPSGQPTR